MTAPAATGSVSIAAPCSVVYALVSNPARLADLASEYHAHRWLDGATHATVGARFRGTNRRGLHRWTTTSTITAADEGRRFAFDVAFGPVPISRWEYVISPAPPAAWSPRARGNGGLPGSACRAQWAPACGTARRRTGRTSRRRWRG
ncbi:SRPBCC family protein [Amycolatopsis sp. CA-161197]|uniref:SRPBCC family protein n=1 Tax=Amycolatopsis sp. CA-161197 TaxID=3239922 RepID=UPI003D8F4AF7